MAKKSGYQYIGFYRNLRATALVSQFWEICKDVGLGSLLLKKRVDATREDVSNLNYVTAGVDFNLSWCWLTITQVRIFSWLIMVRSRSSIAQTGKLKEVDI